MAAGTDLPGLSRSPPAGFWQHRRMYSCRACCSNIHLCRLSSDSPAHRGGGGQDQPQTHDQWLGWRQLNTHHNKTFSCKSELIFSSQVKVFLLTSMNPYFSAQFIYFLFHSFRFLLVVIPLGNPSNYLKDANLMVDLPGATSSYTMVNPDS